VIAGKAHPREGQVAVIKVVVRIGGREVRDGFRGNLTNKLWHGGRIFEACGKKFCGDVAPLVEARTIRSEMA
jgi:hypothetical protein